MAEYIVSQCFFAFGFLFSFMYNFFKVSRKTILYCGVIFNLASAIGFVLLHAWTGALMNILGALLNFIYIYKNKNKFFSLPIIPIIFEILFILGGIFTWQSWLSILPIVGNLIYGVSLWLENEYYIKALNLVVNILYLVYECFLFSYVAVIGTSISILMGLAFLIWGEKYNNFLKNLFHKKNNKNCWQAYIFMLLCSSIWSWGYSSAG